jgi:oligoribonuclease NrnB/cAMP/cGMP phosphodiesterase (DHH superfamily)
MKLTSTVNVVFHSADLDGIGCAMVALYFLDKKVEKVRLHPWNYGFNVPEFPADELVIMMDISFPPDDMLKIGLREADTVWIDHHKTAIEESHKNGYTSMNGVRCDGIAAIKLAWDYFNEELADNCDDAPEGIELLAAYDVWNHDIRNWEEETLPFQFGMRNRNWLKELMDSKDPMETANEFIDVCNWEYNRILDDGYSILKYVAIQNEMSCKRAFSFCFEGITFACLNGHGNSDVFKSVNFLHEAVMLFSFQPGVGWKFSLYSSPVHPLRGDLDLSVIAKKLGGGGHRGACGFEVRDLSLVFGNDPASPAFNQRIYNIDAPEVE